MTTDTEKALPHNQQSEQFQARLNSLLNQEITPENIDYVADQSLDTLIAITQDCTESYDEQFTEPTLSSAEHERAAFDYFGLKDISELLDSLQDKVDGVKQIDEYVSSLPAEDFIITPPDPLKGPTMEGSNGSYEPAQSIPRLKTLLFILNQHLGIDLKDITLTKGTNSPDMMRKESYVSVEVPQLNRTILVCDEEKNATFIFDNQALKAIDMDSEKLLMLSKLELGVLLERYPHLGSRLVYRANWTGNVAQLLVNDVEYISDKAVPVKLLGEVVPAPDGIVSASRLVADLGISNRVIQKVVAMLQEESPEVFGVTDIYKFGSRHVVGYNSTQQALIEARLNEEGYFVGPAPADYKSANALGEELGVDHNSVKRAVAQLQENNPEALGTIGIYRFGPQRTEGYSPEQQTQIKKQLDELGFFHDPAPQEFASIHSFATKLEVVSGVVRHAVESLIAEDPEAFGEIKQYRGKTQVTGFLNPEQQALIVARLEKNGVLAPQPPEGFLTIKGLAKHLGFKSDVTMRKAITSLHEQEGSEFGDIKKYKFSRHAADGLAPHQQALIEKFLRENGQLAPTAPEGYLNLTMLSTQLEVDHRKIDYIVKKITKEAADEFGPIESYRFGDRINKGYNPEQQAMIKKYLGVEK